MWGPKQYNFKNKWRINYKRFNGHFPDDWKYFLFLQVFGPFSDHCIIRTTAFFLRNLKNLTWCQLLYGLKILRNLLVFYKCLMTLHKLFWKRFLTLKIPRGFFSTAEQAFLFLHVYKLYLHLNMCGLSLVFFLIPLQSPPFIWPVWSWQPIKHKSTQIYWKMENLHHLCCQFFCLCL